VRNTRKFLEWIRAKSASKLLAQMKREILMLVPETADGFRATIGALRSLGEGKGESFHTFSLPEDRRVRLLLKNLGKRMSEAEIKELEALHINAQAVMHLRSKRRGQGPEKDRPLTPHFMVSVARGRDVAKVRSVTDLCGLRVKVEMYTAPKWSLQGARKGSAARRMASPRACQNPNRPQPDLLLNRRNWAEAGTTWFKAAAS
jgi:hypothetical protein